MRAGSGVLGDPLIWWLLACSRTCPEGMVALPAAQVRVGEVQPAQPWHLPASQVAVEAFCIDVYEYPNQEGATPRGSVTSGEAAALCAAQGKRLCTSTEWTRACRGVEGRRYSYGPERRSICHAEISGSGPPNGGSDPRMPSGSHPECRSPEGVYDLNGSLAEWVSDPWTGGPEGYAPEATVDETWRTLRGGTMWPETFYGQDCSSRHGHDATSSNGDDGFRCCQSP